MLHEKEKEKKRKKEQEDIRKRIQEVERQEAEEREEDRERKRERHTVQRMQGPKQLGRENILGALSKSQELWSRHFIFPKAC